VIFNSEATRSVFAPFLARAGCAPRAVVAPLGVSLPLRAVASESRPAAPYFVCLGTIEPRKNHLLLLNIWRRLATSLGVGAPRLLIIGRRGWENENAIDMIERCTALKGLVEEHSAVPDDQLLTLLRGARALLLPSFAEGYGLPVAEALAMGVPVLCSGLPALREVGGAAPDYLDPLDGPAWQNAILDYAQDNSLRRQAQLARIRNWRAPLWSEHFAAVDALLDAVGASVSRTRTQAFAPAPQDRLSLPKAARSLRP
jgi:glycosyltransferase involved in cell wall biosynthesis